MWRFKRLTDKIGSEHHQHLCRSIPPHTEHRVRRVITCSRGPIVRLLLLGASWHDLIYFAGLCLRWPLCYPREQDQWKVCIHRACAHYRSMRRRQSRLGYRNILRIADGYVPTVGEKSGNYATIHNSNGAERNSSSLLQSIQLEGLDMTSLIIQSVVGTLFSHSCL